MDQVVVDRILLSYCVICLLLEKAQAVSSGQRM
jgi:hypothetical protein